MTSLSARGVPTFVFFWLRVHAAAHVLKSSAPNSDQPAGPATLSTLVDRTVDFTRRHAALYLFLSLAALIAQGALYFVYRGPIGVSLASSIVVPFIVTAANIRTALDLRAAEISSREFFEWTVGRVWAVILIDLLVAVTYYGAISLILFSETIEGVLFGLFALGLCATLLLADVFASVEPSPGVLRTIPLALMRSITFAWQNANITRLLFILVLQAAFTLVPIMLEKYLLLHHVRGASFLANVPLGTLLAAPFAVLTTVVYFDCVAREREPET